MWPRTRRRRDASNPAPVSPVAAPSQPRHDWARLLPTQQSTSARPPLTIDAERFLAARSGSRSMLAPQREHVPGPAGIMVLDATSISSIVAAERFVAGGRSSPPALPLRRRRRPPRAEPSEWLGGDLLTAEPDVDFTEVAP